MRRTFTFASLRRMKRGEGVTGWAWLVFALLALADWVAVWRRQDSIRSITKPGALLALIAVAIVLEPFDPGIRTIFVAGLALSLAGDVFLLLDERWFVAGLASFLLAHIAYIAGLVLVPVEWWAAAVGIGVVVAAFGLVGRRIVGAVRGGDSPQLVGPVIAYVAVISAMVVAAFATGSAWAAGGALLFFISDSVLAWDRFLASTRWGPVTVMITYHLAQAGLVAWLAFG